MQEVSHKIVTAFLLFLLPRTGYPLGSVIVPVGDNSYIASGYIKGYNIFIMWYYSGGLAVSNARILVAEDDLEINRLITEHLSREGYSVTAVHSGEEAAGKLASNAFDLIILDLMLPKLDGYEVLYRIRSKGNIPVLILSAKCTETDKIIGLGLGADDYMTKPFGVGELTARVRALLRRSVKQPADIGNTVLIRHLDIEMNTETFEVLVAGRPVTLTAKEFDILKLFMQNPRRVFTKAQLFNAIWKDEYLKDENTVMVHIRRLREKIESNPSDPRYIQTVWGIGYKLVEE